MPRATTRATQLPTPLPPSPFLKEPSIYLTVGVARGHMDGPLRGLLGAGF